LLLSYAGLYALKKQLIAEGWGAKKAKTVRDVAGESGSGSESDDEGVSGTQAIRPLLVISRQCLGWVVCDYRHPEIGPQPEPELGSQPQPQPQPQPTAVTKKELQA